MNGQPSGSDSAVDAATTTQTGAVARVRWLTTPWPVHAERPGEAIGRMRDRAAPFGEQAARQCSDFFGKDGGSFYGLARYSWGPYFWHMHHILDRASGWPSMRRAATPLPALWAKGRRLHTFNPGGRCQITAAAVVLSIIKPTLAKLAASQGRARMVAGTLATTAFEMRCECIQKASLTGGKPVFHRQHSNHGAL